MGSSNNGGRRREFAEPAPGVVRVRLELAEQWRPVVGYEGLYEVSDYGRVRSLDRVDRPGRRRPGQVLKQYRKPDGYLTVRLSREGKARQRKVHRLALEAFAGSCPDGMEGCHNDGNPANNHLANLRWDTRGANALDRVRHGTHHEARKAHCPQGHEYTPENTLTGGKGDRKCRTCKRERQAAQRAADPEETRRYYRECARRRRALAKTPDGVWLDLEGDTVGADVLARILRDHPAVEVLTGPDRYDGGRQYLLVKVASPAEVLAAIGTAGGEPPARDVTQCLASACPPPRLDNCQWPRCAARPGLLRPPCGDYDPADPDGPCTTCGRSPAAHRMAAEAASVPWTDDDNDGSAS